MPSDKVLKYMTLRGDADINSKDYEEALLFLTPRLFQRGVFNFGGVSKFLQTVMDERTI